MRNTILGLFTLATAVAGRSCGSRPTTTTTTLQPPDSTPSPPIVKPSVEACKLLGRSDVYSSVGFYFPNDCVSGTGTLNAFMIFVDFSDAPAPSNDPPSNLRDFLEPAAEWYSKASLGALSLNVTADVSRYYRMPAASVYIQDALQAYTDNGESPPLPETEILYVVPTRAASGYITRSIAFNGRTNTREGVYVAKRAITFGTDLFDSWGYQTLNHESGHAMCLPDYYPYADGSDTHELGWIKDENVDCVSAKGTTQHTLTPIEVKGGTNAVVIVLSQTTAVVAEARAAEGLDSSICASGVLLYTIDTTVASGSGPIRVIDTKPSSGGCSGNELNDAPLSLGQTQKPYDSYEIPGLGINVKLTSETGGEYGITVEYS
uniref:Peptidase M6-like domain-containing protein n=1 Tax=Bionectria ochroleuca TaxID=29856 RepID=A0A8H7N741_BIOOC